MPATKSAGVKGAGALRLISAPAPKVAKRGLFALKANRPVVATDNGNRAALMVWLDHPYIGRDSVAQ